MKTLSKTQIWIISICLTVMLGAMAADEEKQRGIAREQMKESIAQAKKERAEQQREFKRLYAEAQYKTGFPAKDKFAVNP